MNFNKLFIVSGITILFVLVLSLFAVEDAQNKLLCHTWELPKYDTQITFNQNGTGSINDLETFTWKSGSGYIQILPDTEMSDWVNYAYTISGNGQELIISNLDNIYGHGKLYFSRL